MQPPSADDGPDWSTVDDTTEPANVPTLPTPQPPSWNPEIDDLVPIDLRFEIEQALVGLDLSDSLSPLSVDATGRFEIHELLGRGAMGAVYRAYDSELDRDIALKVVQLVAPGRENLQDRLLQEARALSRLSHPNVVQVHDIRRASSGERVIALEYIDGPTVRSWQQGRSIDEIIDAYIEIAKGLAEAHDVGVIHRDFKPDNALIRGGDTPRVIVVDFGLAGGAIDDDRTADGLLSPIESTGLGTPEYMAPEQHRQLPTELCDQYAFCVALWEALAGERPFGVERSAAEEMPPGPVRAPAWLYWILRRGLAWEPRERFSSMAALVRALEVGRRFRTGIRWVAAGGVLAATLFVVIRALQPPACADAGAPIDEIWRDSGRAALERRFDRIDTPWAARASAYTLETLDAVAATWSAQAHDVCEAEQASGRSAALDRRRACLEVWLSQFKTSVDLLKRGDASAAEQVVNLLGPLAAGEAWCRLPPPSIGRAVRAKLVEAETHEAARRFDAAFDDARAAVELAKSAPPCVAGGAHSTEAAAANHRLGHVLGKLERWAEAKATLEIASAHALSCGDSWTAFEVRVFQSYADIRTQTQDLALAEARLADAEALLGPVAGPGPSARRADALRMRGLVLASAAAPNHGQASDKLREATSMLDEVDAPLAERVRVRQNLGSIEQLAGSYAKAEAAYAEAQRLLAGAVGGEHPATTRAQALVDLNRGLIALERGGFEAADALFTSAAERGDVVVVASAYAALVQSRFEAGDASRSIVLLRRYQRWLDRYTAALPDSLRAQSLYTMGQLLTQASLADDGGVERPEDFEEGLAWLREAARLWAETEADKALTVRVIIASTLYEAMRHDEATQMLDALPAQLPDGLANSVLELRQIISRVQ